MSGRRRGRGMVLGKFMPPHAGHVHLVDFARAYVDDLTVVVGTLAREPIPGALRFGWMRELFPDARVVHLTDENPQEPHEHPRFWEIWRESLLRVLPAPPDVVFASEPYGERLAAELGAEWVPVDVAREVVPVSATAIRQDPWTHWRFLPGCVRPYFVKRVCVFGAESTGKTTLARRLAEELGTVAVPEYARTLLEPRGGAMEAEDMERIARGQLASEEALARLANRVLVCDTDVLATVMWSELLFGSCPAWVREEADALRYDLTIVPDVDVPFVPDPVRYRPADRAEFHARGLAELAARGRQVLVVRGTWEERFAAARDAVAGIFMS